MFSSDDMLGEEKAMNQEVRHIMKTGSSTYGVFLMERMWDRDGPNFSGSDLLTYGAIYACSDMRHVMVASCSEVSEVLGLGKRLDMSATRDSRSTSSFSSSAVVRLAGEDVVSAVMP